MDRVMKMRKGIFRAMVLLVCFMIWGAGAALGDEAPMPAGAPAGAEAGPHPVLGAGAFLADHFAYDVRIISFGVLQQPTDSTQNPSNNFLKLPRYVGDGEAGPISGSLSRPRSERKAEDSGSTSAPGRAACRKERTNGTATSS